MSSKYTGGCSCGAIRYEIEASDQWSYYQAKSIKAMLTQDATEKNRYKDEEKEIQKKAEERTRKRTRDSHPRILRFCRHDLSGGDRHWRDRRAGEEKAFLAHEPRAGGGWNRAVCKGDAPVLKSRRADRVKR